MSEVFPERFVAQARAIQDAKAKTKDERARRAAAELVIAKARAERWRDESSDIMRAANVLGPLLASHPRAPGLSTLMQVTEQVMDQPSGGAKIPEEARIWRQKRQVAEGFPLWHRVYTGRSVEWGFQGEYSDWGINSYYRTCGVLLSPEGSLLTFRTPEGPKNVRPGEPGSQITVDQWGGWPTSGSVLQVQLPAGAWIMHGESSIQDGAESYDNNSTIGFDGLKKPEGIRLEEIESKLVSLAMGYGFIA